MIGFILLFDFIGDLLPDPLEEMILLLIILYRFVFLPNSEFPFFMSPALFRIYSFFPDLQSFL